MQDDYNRFIKRSIQQARCNYEDIFAPSGDEEEAMPHESGCMGTQASQMGMKDRCMGAEASQMGMKDRCMGAEASQMGVKDRCTGAEASQMGMKTCCDRQAEKEESCTNDKMYRPACELPVMVFIEPQTFGRLYNEAEGLKRGTIFPALDKPFYGRGGKC